MEINVVSSDEQTFVKERLSALRKGLKTDMLERGIMPSDMAESLFITPTRFRLMLDGAWPITATLLARIAYRLEISKKIQTNRG